MDFFISVLENKMLLLGIIGAIALVVIAIILIKKGMKKADDNVVEIEKIDGENSVFDEILEEKEKTNSSQLDLDSMIEKMQKDLDAKASDVVAKFEQEQEEKSVISYSELVSSKEPKQLEMEIVTPDEKVNNDINYLEDEAIDDDLSFTEKLLNEIEDNKEDTKEIIEEKIDDNKASFVLPIIDSDNEMDNIDNTIPSKDISKLNMKDDFVEAIKTGDYEEIKEKTQVDNKNKFKATEFISPIYGIQDIKMQYPTVQNMKEMKRVQNYNKFELDQTLNMDKIHKEASQDEDFLKALKDFRRNLE